MKQSFPQATKDPAMKDPKTQMLHVSPALEKTSKMEQSSLDNSPCDSPSDY